MSPDTAPSWQGISAAIGVAADTALMLLLIGVAYLLLPHTRPVPPRLETQASDLATVRVGQVLRLDGTDWHKSARNVVLLIRTTCPYSNRSAAFYAKLSAYIKRDPSKRLVVVTGPLDAAKIRPWLTVRQIEPQDVITAKAMRSLGFRKTPTLMILDSTGIITDVFVGVASPEQEQRVMHRIENDGSPLDRTLVPEAINGDRISRIESPTEESPLIDIRERDQFSFGHDRASINIPLAELAIRAPIELTAARRVVLDCSHVSPSNCMAGATALMADGFVDVEAAIAK